MTHPRKFPVMTLELDELSESSSVTDRAGSEDCTDGGTAGAAGTICNPEHGNTTYTVPGWCSREE